MLKPKQQIILGITTVMVMILLTNKMAYAVSEMELGMAANYAGDKMDKLTEELETCALMQNMGIILEKCVDLAVDVGNSIQGVLDRYENNTKTNVTGTSSIGEILAEKITELQLNESKETQ